MLLLGKSPKKEQSNPGTTTASVAVAAAHQLSNNHHLLMMGPTHKQHPGSGIGGRETRIGQRGIGSDQGGDGGGLLANPSALQDRRAAAARHGSLISSFGSQQPTRPETRSGGGAFNTPPAAPPPVPLLPPQRKSSSPRGIQVVSPDRLSTLAAFVSEKRHRLAHRASFSFSSSSSSNSNSSSTSSTTSSTTTGNNSTNSKSAAVIATNNNYKDIDAANNTTAYSSRNNISTFSTTTITPDFHHYTTAPPPLRNVPYHNIIATNSTDSFQSFACIHPTPSSPPGLPPAVVDTQLNHHLRFAANTPANNTPLVPTTPKATATIAAADTTNPPTTLSAPLLAPPIKSDPDQNVPSPARSSSNVLVAATPSHAAGISSSISSAFAASSSSSITTCSSPTTAVTTSASPSYHDRRLHASPTPSRQPTPADALPTTAPVQTATSLKGTQAATTPLKKVKSVSTESLLDSTEEPTFRTTLPIRDSAKSSNSARETTKSPTGKMHQTSSRLLRMTDDDRPFTRDFKDLFSTLIVSLPLTTHRIRFKSYPFSFTSEEAINNLGSLKFSQSNRMPDPKDASRIVTTTTTTTFSMAKEMARSVCQRFMDARFVELADGKATLTFPLKGSLWQLTPKGIHILERFCQRNGIQQEHVLKLLQSPYNTMRLVILERDPRTDKLSHDKTTTEVLFRRFVGPTPNIKSTPALSDNDSVSEYQDGITGVKLAETRKIYDKVAKDSFTGKCAVDWLLDCCTTVERAETHEVVALFVQHGLIQSVLEDKVYIQANPKAKDFQPTKNAIYIITKKGKQVAGWIEPERLSAERNPDGSREAPERGRHGPRDQRETNTTRLTAILNDAALRLLYREFLRETVCEENLAFYLDVMAFNENFNAIDLNKSDAVRETLAAAYGLYNAFLAPGSPCELNIDHTLRQDMASRMTRAVAKDDASMYQSLKEVATLFDRAQQQVFKLMAGDSVPKFIRTQKYNEVVGDIMEDERQAALANGINRSTSRTTPFNGSAR